jgi:hypothetical protein
MSYNLFVAFDARDPVREASLVLAAIEELGQAVRLFSTFWYVRSRLTAPEAARRLWDIMQPEDVLLVVNASTDEAAAFNIDDAAVEWMQKRWHLRLEERRPRLSETALFREAAESLHEAGRAVTEASARFSPRTHARPR